MTTPGRPAHAGDASTQRLAFIPQEIKGGIAIFRGPRYRAILETSTLNLSLLADDALLALEGTYHTFLAGLDFPLQILVRATMAEVRPYAAHVRDAAARLDDPFLLRLALSHQAHVERLAAQRAPLDRRVYLVVPADDTQGTARDGRLLPWRRQGSTAATSFEDAVSVLRARCLAVTSGLGAVGLHAHRLDTHELVSLWYACLCPRTSRLQPLTDDAFVAVHTPISAAGGSHGRVPA